MHETDQTTDLVKKRKMKKIRERSRGAVENKAVEEDLFNSKEGQIDSSESGSGSTGGSATKKGMAGAAKSLGGGGSNDDAVGDGLMASGNPYAMAAGAALKVASAKRSRDYKEDLAVYSAQEERKKRLINALTTAAQSASNWGL